MKLPILFALTLLIASSVFAGTKNANAAIVYCQYVDYPAGCIVRPGVVLRPRPIARAAVRPGTPMNRGGPVNRVGRR